MKTASYILTLVLLTISCQTDNHFMPNKLDYYFNPQQTEIVLSFPTIDTVNLSMSLWQHIEHGDKFETVIEPTTNPKKIQKSFVIEKPLLVEIKINGFRDEIFILPNEAYNIEYSINEKGLIAKFSNDISASINSYYDKKAALVGNQDVRAYYSSLAASSTFELVLKEFDLLENKFLDLLSSSKEPLKLPQWFIDYESKNIKTANVVYSIGLSSYQTYLGIESESSQEVEKRLEAIMIEDPIGITTDFHLALLDIYLSKTLNQEDLKSSPEKRYFFFNEESIHLKNERIRDIFNANLLTKISKSSFDYSKGLKDKILTSISKPNRSYVNELINNPSLVGKTAPNFYLKDTNGEFTDSRTLKGKLVLLNFWSTTCRPCIEQFPFEDKLLKALEGEDFEIVKICMNTSEDKWRKVLEKYKVKGINLNSNKGWDKRLSKKYNNPAYSQYVLIDTDGKVLFEKSLKPDNPALLKVLRAYL